MDQFNKHATHVVSQIEYGSEVYIELVHTGYLTNWNCKLMIIFLESMSDSQTDISGNLKVSVKLVAGMIEGDGSLNLGESQQSFSSKTSFTIHGTLKQTIFATSFDGLKELITEIKDDTDKYISEVPQENYLIFEVGSMRFDSDEAKKSISIFVKMIHVQMFVK